MFEFNSVICLVDLTSIVFVVDLAGVVCVVDLTSDGCCFVFDFCRMIYSCEQIAITGGGSSKRKLSRSPKMTVYVSFLHTAVT